MRVRRAKTILARSLNSLERMGRDLDRGRIPEGIDPGKLLGTVEKWLDVLGRGEDRLEEIAFEAAGGASGRAAAMDLAAARDDVLGRLARLAGDADP